MCLWPEILQNTPQRCFVISGAIGAQSLGGFTYRFCHPLLRNPDVLLGLLDERSTDQGVLTLVRDFFAEKSADFSPGSPQFFLEAFDLHSRIDQRGAEVVQ